MVDNRAMKLNYGITKGDGLDISFEIENIDRSIKAKARLPAVGDRLCD